MMALREAKDFSDFQSLHLMRKQRKKVYEVSIQNIGL